MTNLKLININNQIQDDKKLILQGLLNKKQKYLLPKYFYDEKGCLLYTSPSPRDLSTSRMPSSA